MNEKTSAFLCCFAVFVWTTSAESGNMRTTKGQEYNKHSKWTECTVPCGGGYSYRIRECKDLSGDPDCEKSEKKRCNTNPCEQKPNIQDKAYTEYSEWSQCSASCGGGLSFRVRECDKLSGDVDCEESESKSCNELPCNSVSRMEYTEYGNWSACTASCGGGFTFRIRECEDLSGDPDCEESERKSCNEQPCEPNGGLQSIEERSLLPPSFSTLASTESASSKYHEYGDWSPCTVTCGNGFSFRVKECKDLSGDPDCEKSERKECNERPCDEDLSNNTEKPIVSKEIPSELESQREDLIEERSLVLHTLPPVATSESENDKYVEYGEWSPCTAPCGGGFTFRVKECKDLSGDPDCEKSEKRRCNEQSCDPAPTKEKYEEYSPWTRCTVTCGGGYTFRTRECSDLTGDPGCEDTEKKKCNMQPCETEKETKVAGDKEKDLIGDSSLLIFTTPPTPPTKTERTTNENSVTGEIDGENLVERLKLVIEEPADFSNISEGFVEGRDIGIPTVVQTTMAILPTASRVHESSTTPTDAMTSIPMTATTQMITQPLSTGTSRQEVIRNCGIRQLTPLGSFLELNAPRFKNGQRYDCAWTITVPENDTIFAVVYYFNTVECCDVLKVLDGSETVALFNGNFTNEQEFITKTNTISLQFKSDGGSGARRFRIRYTIRSLLTVLPTNIPDRVTPTSPSKIDGTPTATLSRLTSAPIVQEAKCIVTLVAKKLVRKLASPKFQKGERYKCMWKVLAPRGKTINAMVSYYSKAKCCNSLKIFDDKQALATITGQRYERKYFVTKSNKLIIRFKSQPGKGEAQFRIQYRLTDNRLTLPSTQSGTVAHQRHPVHGDKACGGISVASGVVKVLLSPHFIPDSRYSCDWKVIAPMGMKLRIVVHYYNTEECCDKLEIFDGKALLDRISGNFYSRKRFLVTSGSLRIRFTSKGGFGERRFRIYYRIDSHHSPLVAEPLPEPHNVHSRRHWW